MGEFTNIMVEVKLDGLRYPCVCVEYVMGEFTNIRVEVKLDGLRYPCLSRVC